MLPILRYLFYTRLAEDEFLALIFYILVFSGTFWNFLVLGIYASVGNINTQIVFLLIRDLVQTTGSSSNFRVFNYITANINCILNFFKFHLNEVLSFHICSWAIERTFDANRYSGHQSMNDWYIDILLRFFNTSLTYKRRRKVLCLTEYICLVSLRDELVLK